MGVGGGGGGGGRITPMAVLERWTFCGTATGGGGIVVVVVLLAG